MLFARRRYAEVLRQAVRSFSVHTEPSRRLSVDYRKAVFNEINCQDISGHILSEVEKDCHRFKVLYGKSPTLYMLRVGRLNDSYLKSKMKACSRVGISSHAETYPADFPEGELISRIHALNASPDVHGIVVQLPLPAHIDAFRVFESIAPSKDVEGLHAYNIGSAVLGREIAFLPCTALAIAEILQRTRVGLAGKHLVFVGKSCLLGLPLANILTARLWPDMGPTVTMCSYTNAALSTVTRTADILVVAIGQPWFVTASNIKDGAVLIDVGVNVVKGKDGGKKRIVGDVREDAYEKCALYTPVPRGVGPVTVSLVVKNTVDAAFRGK